MAKICKGPDLEKYYSKARAFLSLKLPRPFMLIIRSAVFNNPVAADQTVHGALTNPPHSANLQNTSTIILQCKLSVTIC